MKIQILTSINSWLNQNKKEEFIKSINKFSKKINYVNKITNLKKNYDVCIILNFFKIIPKNKLKYSKFNLVVRESDLPKGRGSSPLAWQILNNKKIITFTLFEASKNLDSGKYYFKKKVYFGNNLLFDEIKEKQFVNSSFLIIKFLKKINKNIVPKSFFQNGKTTYFLRRYKDNSQLNIKKSLHSQFNLLRICDNKNYPAFFKIYNKKYIVKILKS